MMTRAASVTPGGWLQHPGETGGRRRHRGAPGLCERRGCDQAGELLLLGPDRQDLLPVVVAKFRRRRVIQAGRLVPVPGLDEQFLEETGGIGGIGLRIERGLEVREGVRVVHQVDLTATDVDRSDPVCLHGAHGRDRLCLGVVEVSLALGIHGPGPGMNGAGDRVPAAALDPGYCRQQMGRHPGARSAAATADRHSSPWADAAATGVSAAAPVPQHQRGPRRQGRRPAWRMLKPEALANGCHGPCERKSHHGMLQCEISLADE